MLVSTTGWTYASVALGGTIIQVIRRLRGANPTPTGTTIYIDREKFPPLPSILLFYSVMFASQPYWLSGWGIGFKIVRH